MLELVGWLIFVCHFSVILLGGKVVRVLDYRSRGPRFWPR